MDLTDFKNKKVLIMGLGLHGGGVGTAAFFSRLGSRVIVTDLKTRRELRPSIAKLRRFKNITYHLGGHRSADFTTVDYVVKGPGVPETSRFLTIARRIGTPILSDVEVFFRACPAPIIGVTGTKGKSTVTWLLGQFLKAAKKRVWVGGNIRKSVLELLPRVKKGDRVVLELSSFQLDSLKNSRLAPHIAVITNIFPDHLNRYPSMRAYTASKANIFRYQKPDDYLFVNAQDPRSMRLARRAPSRVIRCNPKVTAGRFLRFLPAAVPSYHVPNLACAIAVAQHLGVGDRAIRNVFRRFRGMPGRVQRVRVVSGVSFVNDTTATNPTAAERAIREVKRVIGKRGLYVIAGGSDKGLPLRDFVQALVRNAALVVFLPGTATAKMRLRVKRQKLKIPVRDARTMREAVAVAYRNARRGDVVLLSPGAASFGLFKHEFDRGEQFVRAAKKLRG